MQLSNKEKMLLQDQKSHETLCVQKYHHYANEASDPQLKQLFNDLAGKEQQHYNTINQILSGQTSNTQQSGGQQGGQQSGGQTGQQGGQQSGKQMGQLWGQGGGTGTMAVSGQTATATGTATGSDDSMFCQDMLATEKYVSGTYDTAIFEFVDPNLRQALNHIQKEEQQHGEEIFNYMQNKGMYKVQ